MYLDWDEGKRDQIAAAKGWDTMIKALETNTKRAQRGLSPPPAVTPDSLAREDR
jgi:hypothetical protein